MHFETLRRRMMRKTTFVLGLCALLAMSTSAFASSLCTTVACVAPTDNVNWASFGPPGTVWATPQAWLSTGATNVGLVGVVGPTNFTSMQQSVSWNGNFAPNDWLIWNQDVGNFTGNAGPTGVVFINPVSAAGAQIQAD